MNNRVNGVLAVTRALGDSSMKEFVVGAPYTTETELSEEDEFLIIACDGVRVHFHISESYDTDYAIALGRRGRPSSRRSRALDERRPGGG